MRVVHGFGNSYERDMHGWRHRWGRDIGGKTVCARVVARETVMSGTCMNGETGVEET